MTVKLLLRNIFGISKTESINKPSFKTVLKLHKAILESNGRAASIISDIGKRLGGRQPADIDFIKRAHRRIYIKRVYRELSEAVFDSIKKFDVLTENGYLQLHGIFNGIDGRIKRIIDSGDGLRDIKSLLDYILPLNLVDPMMNDFTPENCRTLHDILRFIQEKSSARLIGSLRNGNGLSGPAKLDISVPAGIMLVDLEGGLKTNGNRLKPKHA